MRVRLLNLLLLAALVLAASKLVQFLREPPPALPPIAPGAAPAAPGPAAGDEAEPPAGAPPESFDVIVSRDLFSPTRGVVPPAPAAAAKPAARPTPPPKLTLYGVVILDGERTAFLQEGTQESRPKKVRERESFAGGTVTAIRPDGVTFLFGGSEVVIPLRTPKEVPVARGADAAAASAAARARTPVNVQRRQQPPAVVPGQMPIGGAPGPASGQPAQEPAGTGMPVFPGAAEPADEFDTPQEEVAPEEDLNGGEGQGMPMGEGTE